MVGTVEHIHARNAALYVDKDAISFGAAVSLDQAQGGATIFKVKNVTITPPMSEVEVINLWGEDSLDTIGSNVVVTGTFQHQTFDEKSWTAARVTFTLVMSSEEAGITTPDGDSLETLFHGAGLDVADTPAFTRYTYGSSVTPTRLLVGNIGFVWNNGTAIKNAQMVKAIVTKMGDLKLTGVDGHWEQDCEATCLHNNFTIENED